MYSAALLVLFASCALTATNARHVRDLSEEQDSPESKEECIDYLLPCLVEMSEYASADDLSETVQSATIRTHCTNLISVTRCFNDALAKSVCSDILTPNDLNELQKLTGFFEYVCVDKLDDLEEHEDCFRDDEFSDAMEICSETNFSDTKCDVSEFVTCSENAVTESPKCDAGAETLLSDVAHELAKIIPHCNGFKQLRHLYRKFF